MLIYLQLIDDPADRVKFEDLYRTYRSLMLYVANQILHNQQDAEDAVHEAFLAVAKNFSKISSIPRHKIKSYLVTITERKAIDLYRRKQRHPTGEFLEELEGVTVEYSGDDGLAQCILNLPARYREMILLKYEQGLTNRELAKVLHLSEDAVRKLDQRARDALEKLCREEGVL